MAVRAKFKVVSVVDETPVVSTAAAEERKRDEYSKDRHREGDLGRSLTAAERRAAAEAREDDEKARVANLGPDPNDMYARPSGLPTRRRIVLDTHYDRGITEDLMYAKSVPWGRLELLVDNPSAMDALLLGSYVYLDLTHTPDLRPIQTVSSPVARVSDPLAPLDPQPRSGPPSAFDAQHPDTLAPMEPQPRTDPRRNRDKK